jgi:hypothetical protein
MSGQQSEQRAPEKIIEAKEISINQLFSPVYMFNIPFYQRPLTWGQAQFEQLIRNISDSMGGAEGHFLGSILLQYKAPGHYDLVDGQQRMTALAILMAVIRDTTDKADLRKTMQECIYQEENKWRKLPQSMRVAPWKEMQELFEKYIYCQGGTRKFIEDFDNGYITYHDTEDPEYHLYEAISAFQDGLPTAPVELEAFVMHMLHNVYMVLITTKSELSSAFRLFHTLNTTGLDLTPSDILKAENLGVIKEDNKQKEYAEVWQSMEEEIGRSALAEVIAHIRTIKKKEKARLGIYEEYQEIFEKGIMQRGAGFIDYVKEIADIYEAKVLSPEIKSDSAERRNSYKLVIGLMKYMPFSDWVPPLLAFYHKFKSDENLLDFALKVEKKVFIEWASGFSETERITSLSRVVEAIEQMSDPKEVVGKLLTSKPEEGSKSRVVDFSNSEEVKNSLMRKLDDKRFYTFYSARFARYVLLRADMDRWELENFQGYPGPVTVEHILPRNPEKDSQWVRLFSKEEMDEWTDKLGNLALLSGKRNSKAQNFDFNKKKDVYFKQKTTPFMITRELQSIPQWDILALKNRHEALIKGILSAYS